MWRPHLVFLASRLDARWQEVLGLVTRIRVATALWLESEQPASVFTRSEDSAVACFFSALSGNGYSGLCCELWHAASEPCQSHISTCQSDGADLSPVNLSCSGA